MPSSLRSRFLVAGLILTELLASLADLLLGPWGRVHWEERFNARAGVQIACGHLDRAFELQYVPFCGGCTGEALLAAPLYLLLEPTVLVWKAVPLAFHAVVLAFGARLAWAASGPRAAAAFVLLLAGAPGYYRELLLTGWGNHVESAAFPLAAAALLLAAVDRSWWQRLPLLLLAGLVTGLGLWFCHTMAWSLLPLGLGAVLVSWWAWPLFVAGVPAGFLPWRAYFEARPDETQRTLDWAISLSPAPPAALLDWLGGSYLRWGLWDPADYGEGSWLHGAWWFGLWGLGLLGLGWVLRGLADADGRTRIARLFAPVGLAALLVAYALRWDLWAHLPEVPSQPTLGLRYRAPLVPLLSLGAASALARAWSLRRGRWPVVLLLAGLVGFGLAKRIGQWGAPHTELPGLKVYAHDGWRDRSVPLGEPPQRLVRAQGRPQDVQAALDFLNDHVDGFPECHLDHWWETGRRLGIGIDERGPQALAQLAGALPQEELELRFLADGVAFGLVGKDGSGLAELEQARIDADPALSAALGRAAGRRVAEDLHPGQEQRLELSTEAADGLCEARGRAWAATPDGEVDPFCAQRPAWWQGVGLGWAVHTGCDDAAAAELAALADDPDTAWSGLVLGCLQQRGLVLEAEEPADQQR